MNEWLAWLAEQGRSDTTIKRYGSVMNLFLNHVADGGEMTPTDVREWRESLLRAGRTPAAINLYLAALRSYGEWLVVSGRAPSNPAAQVRGVKEQRLAPRWLEAKDQAALTRTIERMILESAWNTRARVEATRNRAMLWLMLYAGLRVSELCALRDDDVTLLPKSGHAVVRDGKGGKRRTVPLPLPARRAVAEWRAVRGPSAMLFGLTARMAQNVVGAVAHRARVHCTPHTLRHTYAHNLRAANVSMDKIAALMGHAKLSTTLRYTLPSAHELAEAVSVLE